MLTALSASLLLSLPQPTQQQDAKAEDPRLAAIERFVTKRMREHTIPGVSVAVVDGGKIAWARGFGVKKAKTKTKVTPKTLFQAASISKPVAALAALRLVESGKLTLDDDVQPRLESHRIRMSRRLKGSTVNVRQLLSHSAGVTVHGFAGYPSDAKAPDLLTVLAGKSPANSPPIGLNRKPGWGYRYSGGGYCILQQLIQDTCGEPFATTMHRVVIEPIAMRDSTYAQPLPTDRHAQAAAAHNSGNVVRGQWNVYPEQAAAGLWTTPSDLGRFAIALQRAIRGAPKAILKRELATAMIRGEHDANDGKIGLGVFLNGSGKGLRFSHGGANHGFRCYFEAVAHGDQAAVVMTNDGNGGRILGSVVAEIAARYGWPKRNAERAGKPDKD